MSSAARSGWFLYHRGARKCSHDCLYHAGQPACLLHHEGALKFGEENGKTVVAGYLTSNFYWEDGKVHPTVSRAESDLDEGIWDFLSQSVVGFISQSKWDVYELEAFNFNQRDTHSPLSNGQRAGSGGFRLEYAL